MKLYRGMGKFEDGNRVMNPLQKKEIITQKAVSLFLGVDPNKLINYRKLGLDIPSYDDIQELKRRELTTAKQHRPVITEVIAPLGAKYLSDFYNELPENQYLEKGRTGCGGSTIALTGPKFYVVATPSTELIKNKVKQANENFNNLYPYEVFGIYAGVTKLQLELYLSRTAVPKIMVTYDSLWKLSEWIDTTQYNILIDEYHCLFTSYSFRRYACRVVLNHYKRYRAFTFMSATPLKTHYMFHEIKDIDIVRVSWPGSKLVSVKPKLCGVSVEQTVVNITKGFLDGTHVGNAYFFVNSTTFINKIIAACNLLPENTRVIYSENNHDVKIKNKIKRGSTSDDPMKINFITSAAFEGCDIYDVDGKTFIVSDATKKHTLQDISIQIPQIIGRIRNSKYCLNVVHLYSLTKIKEGFNLDFQDYCTEIDKRLESASIMLSSYNATSDEFARSSMRKLIKYGSSEEFHEGIEFLEVEEDDSVVLDSHRHVIAQYAHEIINGTYSTTGNFLSEYDRTGMIVEDVEEDWSKEMIPVGNIKSFKSAVQTYMELSSKEILTYDEEQLLAECENYYLVKSAITNLGYDKIVEMGYKNIGSKLLTLEADLSPEHRHRAVDGLLKAGGRYAIGAFVSSNNNRLWMTEAYKEVGWKKKPDPSKEILNYMYIKPKKELIKYTDATGTKHAKDTRGFVVLGYRFAA